MHIAIAGNIGSGKTTLTKMLAALLLTFLGVVAGLALCLEISTTSWKRLFRK